MLLFSQLREYADELELSPRATAIEEDLAGVLLYRADGLGQRTRELLGRVRLFWAQRQRTETKSKLVSIRRAKMSLSGQRPSRGLSLTGKFAMRACSASMVFSFVVCSILSISFNLALSTGLTRPTWPGCFCANPRRMMGGKEPFKSEEATKVNKVRLEGASDTRRRIHPPCFTSARRYLG
jgi:hypothetical protein